MIRKTIHDKILSTPQFTWFDIIKFKRLEKPHKVLETTTMNNKNNKNKIKYWKQKIQKLSTPQFMWFGIQPPSIS